jgi:hypothetical protein
MHVPCIDATTMMTSGQGWQLRTEHPENDGERVKNLVRMFISESLRSHQAVVKVDQHTYMSELKVEFVVVVEVVKERTIEVSDVRLKIRSMYRDQTNEG